MLLYEFKHRLLIHGQAPLLWHREGTSDHQCVRKVESISPKPRPSDNIDPAPSTPKVCEIILGPWSESVHVLTCATLLEHLDQTQTLLNLDDLVVQLLFTSRPGCRHEISGFEKSGKSFLVHLRELASSNGC